MTPDQIAQFEALVKLGEKAAQCTHPKRTPSRAAGSYDHDKAPVEFCDTCGATCYWGEPTPVDDSHLLVEVQAPVLAQLLAAWRRADTEIAALRTKLAELERERDDAHKALDACARNLGNGANTDGASHEFKLIVPTEVKLVVERLERRAQAAEADCAALREAMGNLFTQEIRAVGCVERMVNWLESALVMTQADKALWLKEAHAFLRRKGPTEAVVTAALAQPNPGQPLLDRLADAEAKLAGAMRVVEAATTFEAAPDGHMNASHKVAAERNLKAALAAMTPPATITREDA